MKIVHRKNVISHHFCTFSAVVIPNLVKPFKIYQILCFPPRDLIWFSNKTSEDQQGLLSHSADSKDGFPKPHD